MGRRRNVFFAALYLLELGCIADARADSFADAFSFNVQTMATIGFGRLNPVPPYADGLLAIEGAVGLIGAAFATGLVFAKAARPRSIAPFSKVVVVTSMNGAPTLVFRIGNARGNDIVDATVSVTALGDTVTPEGEHLRRQMDLPLVRFASPFFRLTWTVMQRIDEDSPLRDIDWRPSALPRNDPGLLVRSDPPLVQLMPPGEASQGGRRRCPTASDATSPSGRDAAMIGHDQEASLLGVSSVVPA